MQKQFLTFAFGGSSKWNGRNLRAVHKKMDLLDEHFDAIAECLVATINDLKVPQDLINEVMTIVGSTKPDVLNR